MRVKVTLTMKLETEDAQPLPYNDAVEVADITVGEIHNRLFGCGFLPESIIVDDYTIVREVIGD